MEEATKGSSLERVALLTPWLWASALQTVRETFLLFLSHQVRGDMLQQPLILVTVSIFKSLVLKHWTSFEETRLEGLNLQSRQRATCRSSRARRGERLGCSHERLDPGLPCRGQPALTSALLPGRAPPAQPHTGLEPRGSQTSRWFMRELSQRQR